MDQRERINDPVEALRVALDGFQARLWTQLPVLIQSFDPDKCTCTAQPAIQGVKLDKDGSTQNINLPLLLDCPVIFPQGGGFTLTFPIKKGDEAIAFFASRCIDAWWQSGGIQPQAELRMHNLSDGFVLVGVRSQGRPLSPSPNANNVQLRSDNGSSLVEINPSGDVRMVAARDIALIASRDVVLQAGRNMTLTAAGEMDINATTLKIAAATEFTGTVKANGKSIDETHTHGGVQTGGGTTGPVS